MFQIKKQKNNSSVMARLGTEFPRLCPWHASPSHVEKPMGLKRGEIWKTNDVLEKREKILRKIAEIKGEVYIGGVRSVI